MGNQPWLEVVRERLAQHSLPPTYIQRFLGELSDHLVDLKEENMDKKMDAYSRLGEPVHVADAAVVAYRRRTFLGRHPTVAFLVFGISPVLSQIVLCVLVAVGMRVVGALAEGLGIISDDGTFSSPSPLALDAMSYVFSLIFIVVPSILAGVLYCKLVKRLGLSKRWMLVSCIMLAAMAMLPCWCVRLVADGADHPRVLASLWIPFLCPDWSACGSHISQLIQLAVPLAIAWWFMRRKHDHRQLQAAS